ncbi:hypothetical protein F5Y18DRAFT_421759 [Xylariaceae sp. FL1019]|nr:hypothetical protein F5Y18DRAFT_421759 [Xylariaceae sp. FL1019]
MPCNTHPSATSHYSSLSRLAHQHHKQYEPIDSALQSHLTTHQSIDAQHPMELGYVALAFLGPTLLLFILWQAYRIGWESISGCIQWCLGRDYNEQPTSRVLRELERNT